MSAGKDDFAARMVDILNYGALNVAIGLGYKVGLFEALDASQGPVTPDQLAERCGLNARVVQELVGRRRVGRYCPSDTSGS
jgi:hypothetical protein